MDPYALLATILPFFVVASVVSGRGQDLTTSFFKNYLVAWGGNHVSALDQGREIQLSMDNTTGSGFSSKLRYGSGFFHMRIKLPAGDSAGVVTAFYLTSDSSNHEELDFEFLGNRKGKPYTIQTNIFANGQGNREQRVRLWFDPAADFHDYRILWNSYQIVFFVDSFPIRVYRNQTSIGIDYPSQPMRILATIWDGDDWATDGGKAKINWSYAPFTAQFQGFDVEGCAAASTTHCSSSGRWDGYSGLSGAQQTRYELVRRRFMFYDYCTDKARNPIPPPECSHR